MFINLFYYLRVSYKLFKRRYFSINSFCKECGRDVHDFSVDNEVWEKVDKTIKRGHVLCYDCFCKKCDQLNLPTIWKLVENNGVGVGFGVGGMK